MSGLASLRKVRMLQNIFPVLPDSFRDTTRLSVRLHALPTLMLLLDRDMTRMEVRLLALPTLMLLRDKDITRMEVRLSACSLCGCAHGFLSIIFKSASSCGTYYNQLRIVCTFCIESLVSTICFGEIMKIVGTF